MMFKKNINNLVSTIRGNNFKNQYLEISRIQDKDDLLKFKQDHLTKLIFHAYKNVRYYHDVFKRSGIVNNKKVDLSRFVKIPVLTKKILRNHQQNLISKDYTTRKWFYNYSGGSTGEPTKFIQDNNYKKWTGASNKYYYQNMLDVDYWNVKKVILWGNPDDIFKGSIGIKGIVGIWLNNIKFLNSFKMTKKDMEKYIKIINSFKPVLVRGYANSLYELCRFAESNNLKIYTPRMVVSSAETLNNEIRNKIESVFGTKLYDFYGSRETASLAGECKCGLKHIFEFNNYIEILDENNQPSKEGAKGRIIVTSFHNFSMPFIRYEIGDMAMIGFGKCKCGNILPTLESICGRIEEQFIRKDGSIVIGYFFVHLMGVVLNKGFIKKFQVIQENYDKIRILVIPNLTLPDYEKKDIEDKIRVQMGKDCIIIWDIVDDIPKTKSGKFIYTKSLLNL